MRCGFTLIELLVVIAIIAILIALLRAGGAAGRARPPRAQCSEQPEADRPGDAAVPQRPQGLPQQRRLGRQADHRGHVAASRSRRDTFDFTTNKLYQFGVGDPRLGPTDQTGSWAYAILPYLEQNAAVREPRVADGQSPVYICPARRRRRADQPSPPGRLRHLRQRRLELGTHRLRRQPDTPSTTAPTATARPAFTDGLSNTILVGEKAYDIAVQEDSWYYDESFFLGGSKGTSRRRRA